MILQTKARENKVFTVPFSFIEFYAFGGVRAGGIGTQIRAEYSSEPNQGRRWVYKNDAPPPNLECVDPKQNALEYQHSCNSMHYTGPIKGGV